MSSQRFWPFNCPAYAELTVNKGISLRVILTLAEPIVVLSVNHEECTMYRISLFIIGFIVASSLSAAPLKHIELTDGSVINAEVIALNQGVYTLKSPTLGTMTLAEDKIKVIRSQPAAETPSKQTLRSNQIEALQGLVLNNEDTMEKIMDLQNDPEIQDILQNSEITQAVKAGDLSSLMKQPAFMELLNNPSIQDIQKEILADPEAQALKEQLLR